ncbi:MAG TPA: Rieske 2Fe-2S domain-containing protein, partial [Candidatus Angelobacter sp.]|nr:Rieske 2Fe-2S domain-containing protein [Candidatus Angelobacter sp.]
MIASPQSSLRFSPAAFPLAPAGWSFFCTERELARGPVSITYLDRRLVAFRTSFGQIGILDANCSHMGADLAMGRVVEDCLECPFHNWRFAIDGKCVGVPRSTTVPAFARQRSYPSTILNGLVFMWNGVKALYPLPFYEDLAAEDCVWAGPLNLYLSCPWYLVGANCFDTQHLYSVHERELLAPPAVWSVGDHALASRTVARVGKHRWYDRLIRIISGPEATMTATNWSGSLVLVSAQLKRTTTYGMVSLRPLGEERVLVQIFSWLPRSRSKAVRLVKPLLAAARLGLIRQFLKEDVKLLNSVRPGMLNLIETDHELARYFRWATGTSVENAT